jgi:selenium-binding protein 1
MTISKKVRSRGFASLLLLVSLAALAQTLSGQAVGRATAEHEKLMYALALPIPRYEGMSLEDFGKSLCTDPTNGKEAAGYLATIDVDPDSPAYGQVISRTSTGVIGGELHHMHINAAKTRVVMYDLYASRAFIYDIATDPRNPRLLRSVNLGEESRRLLGPVKGLGLSVGYGAPHESLALDNGNFLIVMNSVYVPERPDLHEGPPGGFIEMTADGQVVDAFPKLSFVDGKLTNHEYTGMGLFSVDYNERFHTFIHADFMTQRTYKCGVGLGPLELGNQVALWHFNKGVPEESHIFQKIDLPTAGLTSPHAVQEKVANMQLFYVSSLTDGIWAIYRGPEQPQFAFKHVYNLPASEGHLSSHIRIAHDNRTIYDTDATADTIHVLRIADDPLNPMLIQRVHAPQIHVVKFSADGKRLYGASGIASIVDFQFRSPPFGVAYGIRMWDVKEDGTLVDTNFFVDASKEPLAPPAGHGVMFADFVLRENPERTH